MFDESEVKIPIPCPDCGGKMLATRYIISLRILKERGWQVCTECSFERSVDDFKKELFTI